MLSRVTRQNSSLCCKPHWLNLTLTPQRISLTCGHEGRLSITDSLLPRAGIVHGNKQTALEQPTFAAKGTRLWQQETIARHDHAWPKVNIKRRSSSSTLPDNTVKSTKNVIQGCLARVPNLKGSSRIPRRIGISTFSVKRRYCGVDPYRDCFLRSCW